MKCYKCGSERCMICLRTLAKCSSLTRTSLEHPSSNEHYSKKYLHLISKENGTLVCLKCEKRVSVCQCNLREFW